MNKVSFFEGSYMFKMDQTDLNITTGYIQYQLAKQYEYRPTTKTLWAELTDKLGNAQRFKLDYDNNKIELIYQYLV